MIKVIAFDLDDTLWEVHPVIIRAEKILSTWLLAAVPDLQYDVVNMRELRDEVLAENPNISYRLTDFRRQLITKAMIKSGFPKSDSIRLASLAMGVFLNARNQVEFYEGALSTIITLAAKYQLGALTNGNADINKLGLADHFQFTFSAEQIGAPKPAPDLFLKALSHTGCRPEEVVYVGDDPAKDVDAAKAVGLKTVWLKHKHKDFTPQSAPQSTPDQIISQISELPQAIAALTSN